MTMISELVYPELKTTQRLNFDGENFTIWKMKVDFVLVDNRVKYVLTDPQPPKSDDPHRHKKWLADDFTCRHLILGAMSDDLHLNFHHHPTAKSIMDALTARFSPANSLTRRIVLFRRYVNRRMDDDAKIAEHILEMGAMAQELKLAGVDVPDEMQAVMLMDSLPLSWEEVVDGLLVRLDLEKEFSLESVSERLRFVGDLRGLRSREKEQGTSNGGNHRRFSKGFRGNCYSCGEPGHYQNDCPYSGGEQAVSREKHEVETTLSTHHSSDCGRAEGYEKNKKVEEVVAEGVDNKDMGDNFQLDETMMRRLKILVQISKMPGFSIKGMRGDESDDVILGVLVERLKKLNEKGVFV